MATTNSASEVPEWIYPGAEVLLYAGSDHEGRPSLYKATIGKIAKTSFLVTYSHGRDADPEPVRIYFEKSGFRPPLSSKDQGNTWSHWYYRVISKDSIEAQRLIELGARSRSRDKAYHAAAEFTKNNVDRDNLDLIRATIIALSAHADLVLAQDTAKPVHRANSSKRDSLTRCGKPVGEHDFYVRYNDNGVTCADCKEIQS